MKFPSPGIIQKHLTQALPPRNPGGLLIADPREEESDQLGVGRSALDGWSRVSTSHNPTGPVRAQTGLRPAPTLSRNKAWRRAARAAEMAIWNAFPPNTVVE